jgi:hypothetical protein
MEIGKIMGILGIMILIFSFSFISAADTPERGRWGISNILEPVYNFFRGIFDRLSGGSDEPRLVIEKEIENLTDYNFVKLTWNVSDDNVLSVDFYVIGPEGEVVYRSNFTDGEIEFNTLELNEGVYVVNFRARDADNNWIYTSESFTIDDLFRAL